MSLISAVAAIGCLATAGTANAAFTIGSNLTTPASDNAPGCNISCTTATLGLPAANQASGGLTSPVNGTVTSWRIASGSSGNPVSLRVLRPAGALTFTGAGTSAAGVTAMGIAGPFATSLPISAGDSIGVDSPTAALILGVNGGATQVFWNIPPLADNTTRLGSAGASREVMVQAVVDPSNALQILRVKRNKRKGLAKVIVLAPNTGSLRFGGRLVKVKGPRRTAPGRLRLIVRARGKKAKKLNRKGKVGVKPKLTYIPDGGSPRTTPAKVKLVQRV